MGKALGVSLPVRVSTRSRRTIEIKTRGDSTVLLSEPLLMPVQFARVLYSMYPGEALSRAYSSQDPPRQQVVVSWGQLPTRPRGKHHAREARRLAALMQMTGLTGCPGKEVAGGGPTHVHPSKKRSSTRRLRGAIAWLWNDPIISCVSRLHNYLCLVGTDINGLSRFCKFFLHVFWKNLSFYSSPGNLPSREGKPRE